MATKMPSECPHPATARSNWGDRNYGCGDCGLTPIQLEWQAYRRAHPVDWDAVSSPSTTQIDAD